jgi:hypothetical protein
VSLGLSTKNLLGIILQFVGVLVCGGRLDGRRRERRCCRVGRGGVSGCDADFERTAGPATRLALLVEQGLGLGFALCLLQAALLAQRCTNGAAAFLADPVASVGEFLLLLFRELWLVRVHPIRRVHPGALLPLVWRLEVWRITHRGPKYRRIQPKPRRSTAIGCSGGHLETSLKAGTSSADGHRTSQFYLTTGSGRILPWR